MISITKSTTAYNFQIGKHQFPVSRDLLTSFADALQPKRIAEMAELKNPWKSANWTLEGAADDRRRDPKTKWEYRKRLLLHIGEQKWHLSQEECLKLGDLCRNLLQGK